MKSYTVILLALTVALLCLASCSNNHVDAARTRRPSGTFRDQKMIQRQVLAHQQRLQPNQSPAPGFSFAEFDHLGHSPLNENDALSQVAAHLERKLALTGPPTASETDNTVLLEMQSTATAQVQKVRSYCEICILVMQMKQRGEPHLCAGLNANYYITCIEILESLLRADKAVVYWLRNGCMHMDSTGPEIVRPCPALSICSWVPNLFAQPPSLVRDGVESLCPKDPKFLPTIPNEYRALLGAEAGQGQAQGQQPQGQQPTL